LNKATVDGTVAGRVAHAYSRLATYLCSRIFGLGCDLRQAP
jgi:hypothetical protein